MASSSGLNVVEHCMISPPSGSTLRLSLPLTIFDVVWLTLPPVQRIFFFEHHCSINQFTNTILPSIKNSLSLALQQFFPLAGNLTWPQYSPRPEIHYVDGDSVSFTVAESGYDFDVVVSNEANDVSAFDPLVPQLINSPAENRFPLTSLLVTLFPGKGISIGIAYNHVVADGRAILHFIKTWASTCQTIQGTSSSTVEDSLQLEPPCVSRSLVKEEPDHETSLVVSNYLQKINFTRDTFYTSKKQHLAVTDKVLATFVMGRAEIKRLKQWVLANKKENAPALHLSTFVLTCAYVWVCSIKARCGASVSVGSEEDQMECLVFPVDCRARLEPPLPLTYFGSCVAPGIVWAKASDLMGEQGIPIAAELIGNVIRDMEHGNAILKKLEWYLSSFTFPQRVLTVAGSPKFGTYDIDFGWGKPKKAQVLSIATSGAVAFSECPSEAGAVEVGLARNKAEMDAFTSLYTSSMQGLPVSD